MSEYFSKMMAYSKSASMLTDIDYHVILAQWYLETGGGTSSISINANNHAGIKSNSKGRDGVSGRYASYDNLFNFTRDYSRVMHLSHYDKVREAKGIEAQVKALHESPWAEDPDYDKKLLKVINGMGDIKVDPENDKERWKTLFGSFDIEQLLNILKSPIFMGGLALIIVLKGNKH